MSRIPDYPEKDTSISPFSVVLTIVCVCVFGFNCYSYGYDMGEKHVPKQIILQPKGDCLDKGGVKKLMYEIQRARERQR